GRPPPPAGRPVHGHPRAREVERCSERHFPSTGTLCHGSRSVRVWRVLSVNSPTGCSAETQPVTWDGLRAQRGTPFTATRERAKLKDARSVTFRQSARCVTARAVFASGGSCP